MAVQVGLKMQYTHRLIDPEVFRAYDIRGIVDLQLDANAFYSIGLAISCQLNAINRTKIILARDGRNTSKEFSRAIAQGFMDSGITVLDLGEVTTPMMYYATHVTDIDSGVMITGSHNPANYNGIKMVVAGSTLGSLAIQELYSLNLEKTRTLGQGQQLFLDIFPQYANKITDNLSLRRKLRVVIDAGNGIAGPFAPAILRALGCEVIELYCEVDGSFPNHHPDPSIEHNLIDLKAAVAQHQADLGLAFDGDADRLGVITDTGESLCPDRLMMYYVPDVLKRHPGATIVYDVKCSRHLATVIQQAGGRPHMCPTGHSIVKSRMTQENSPLAGEMSGHLFFKDRWYGFDDAIYSACRLLEQLSNSTTSISQQFANIPVSINTPELKIPVTDSEKFSVMQRFADSAYFADAQRITIDGLRIEFNDGWGLLRVSNTTPCLVARFEANDINSLERIKSLFQDQLHAVDVNLTLPF